MSTLRSKVIQLYKNLIYLSRDYPDDKFRQYARKEFRKHLHETDPRKIGALIAQGRYMCKELEALYALKKYRALKNRYT